MEILINLIENSIIVFFVLKFLRQNEHYRIRHAIVCIILSTIVLSCINHFVHYEGFLVFINILLFIIVFHYDSEESVETCAIAVLTPFLLIYIINMFLITAATALGLSPASFHVNLILTIVSKILLAVLLFLILKAYQQYEISIPEEDGRILLMNYLFLFLLAVSLGHLTFEASSGMRLYHLLASAALFAVTVSLILFTIRQAVGKKGRRQNTAGKPSDDLPYERRTKS